MIRRVLAGKVALVLPALLSLGCMVRNPGSDEDSWEYRPVGEAEQWSADTIYTFTDRRDSVWEYEYAVRDREVVVQKAVFPGYKDRTWYRHTVQSDDLMNRIKEWAVRPGNAKPPFPPGGPHNCRMSYPPDRKKERGEAWFKNGTPVVGDWFSKLKREFVKDEYRVRELPAWVTGDDRIKHSFGLSE